MRVRMVLLLATCIGCTADAVWADGGLLLARQQQQGWQISVFAAPQPIVAGSIDLSILIQDAHALAVEQDVALSVHITSLGGTTTTHAATTAAATNRLFRSCTIELSPGEHALVIECQDASRHVTLHASLAVGDRPPLAQSLWPWYTWPTVPIAWFVLRACRRPRMRF